MGPRRTTAEHKHLHCCAADFRNDWHTAMPSALLSPALSRFPHLYLSFTSLNRHAICVNSSCRIDIIVLQVGSVTGYAYAAHSLVRVCQFFSPEYISMGVVYRLVQTFTIINGECIDMGQSSTWVTKRFWFEMRNTCRKCLRVNVYIGLHFVGHMGGFASTS